MGKNVENAFDSDKAYRQFNRVVYMYTYGILARENLWEECTCIELAKDIASDAIAAYILKINQGTNIDKPIPYIKKIVDNYVRGNEMIRYKKMERYRVNIFNVDSGNEFSEDYSETITDSSLMYFEGEDIIDRIESHEPPFDSLEKKIIVMLSEGYKQYEIADNLSFSEGYISKILQKIKQKVSKK